MAERQTHERNRQVPALPDARSSGTVHARGFHSCAEMEARGIARFDWQSQSRSVQSAISYLFTVPIRVWTQTGELADLYFRVVAYGRLSVLARYIGGASCIFESMIDDDWLMWLTFGMGVSCDFVSFYFGHKALFILFCLNAHRPFTWRLECSSLIG